MIDKQAWRDITAAAQRIMVFAIIAPLGWRLFWCEREWWRITIAPMNIVERGQTGIVLRPKAGTVLTVLRSLNRACKK
jgi:hypothetical protein